MKLLVASVGNRLDSLIAKRFEHAVWYVIVENAEIVETIRHLTPQDRHAVLVRAASEGVDAAVAGKFSESSLRQLRARGLKIAHLHSLSVADGMRKILAHEVRLDEIEPMPGKQEIMTDVVQRPPMRRQRVPARFVLASATSDSDRGRHHLQQYAGRGH